VSTSDPLRPAGVEGSAAGIANLRRLLNTLTRVAADVPNSVMRARSDAIHDEPMPGLHASMAPLGGELIDAYEYLDQLSTYRRIAEDAWAGWRHSLDPEPEAEAIDSTPAPVFRPPTPDELPRHRGSNATAPWPFGTCTTSRHDPCWCQDARATMDQLIMAMRRYGVNTGA
jgi:hypothetical protein